MARKHEYGMLQIKKTGGVAGSGTYLAVNDQINIPFIGVMPFNPKNVSRPMMGNASAFKSVRFLNKRSPGVRVLSCVKLGGTSWFGHKLVNSGVLSWDANRNSDEFAFNLYDGTANRLYTKGRFSGIHLMGRAVEGVVLCTLEFTPIYGDNEDAAPPSFTSATTDAGQGVGVTEIDFGSSPTIDAVRVWNIRMHRPQVPDYVCDRTLYASRIESRGFFGFAAFQQDPDGAVVPTSGATVRIGTTPNGVSYVMGLDNDQEVYPLDPEILGTVTREFEMWNSGSQPITVASF